MSGDGYHHGRLRRAVLDAAVEALGEAGPEVLSLRALARRAGVSHAAPAHHFGDRAGLLTAVATEAQQSLTEHLGGVADRGGDLAGLGAAYVGWVVDHPARARVLDADHLLRADDPALVAARRATRAVLVPAADRGDGSGERTAVAAWSMAHGFAWLWVQGRLGTGDGAAAARAFLEVARGARLRAR